jgi:hypothetical protein
MGNGYTLRAYEGFADQHSRTVDAVEDDDDGKLTFEGFVLTNDPDQHSGPVDVVEVHDDGSYTTIRSVMPDVDYFGSGDPVDVIHWRDDAGEHVDCRFVHLCAVSLIGGGVEQPSVLD